jgi:rhodanese-related sulfurtransferase
MFSRLLAGLMGLKVISPEGLHQLIEKRGVTVIDVNARERFADGHVPGAKNLDPTRYQDRDLPQDKDADLVFYCSNSMCRKAPNAARRARKMGYTKVQVMSSGIKGWVATDLPTEGPKR